MDATDRDRASEPLGGHADGIADVQGWSAVVHTLAIGVTQHQKVDVAKSRPLDLWTRIAERVRRLPNALPGKVWVSDAFERRRDELLGMKYITDASKALAKESETAPDCEKRLEERYIEKLLRELGVFPKAYRNSPKKRRRT
jgi:hypothetical protein